MMAKRILVPLDGESMASTIVPLIADTARSAGATVRLLHVAPVPANVETRLRTPPADGWRYTELPAAPIHRHDERPDEHVVAYADQEMARLEAESGTRLRETTAAYLAGVPVEYVVRFGDPARETLREIEAFGADLVVVGTKTRSSLSRALLGSVAEELVRRAPVTVMLVRPVATST